MRFIVSKFGGRCADRDCRAELAPGSRVRWYGRGRIYCPGTHLNQNRPNFAVAFSPHLAAKIQDAIRAEDRAAGRPDEDGCQDAYRDGMERAREDTVRASVGLGPEGLSFDDQVERDLERRGITEGDAPDA
jgi:hypothetical protein